MCMMSITKIWVIIGIYDIPLLKGVGLLRQARPRLYRREEAGQVQSGRQAADLSGRSTQG